MYKCTKYLLSIVLLILAISHYVIAEIKPFKVNVSDDALIDLKNRLERTRYPDQLADITDENDFTYGANLKVVKDIANYWNTKFDWRKQEAELNKFDQFTVDIDDLQVHFVHQKSKYQKTYPFLFLHGWPSTFYECYKLIPILTDPKLHGIDSDVAFDVVCPSLPGYGFSSRPTKKGMDIKKVAQVMKKLMEKLEYKSYLAQGGDWGSAIAPNLAAIDPNCKAVHLNLLMSGPPTFWTTIKLIFALLINPNWVYSEKEWNDLKHSTTYLFDGSGYMVQQGTKPQSLAYGLNDSPVGLMGWIVEKYQAWSDCRGNVTNRFTYDEILTDVMIYWVSETISSSIRLYYETLHPVGSGSNPFEPTLIKQPVGISVFRDIVIFPKSWAEPIFDIKTWDEHDTGGHFPAQEEPLLLATDVFGFFNKIRKDKILKDEL